MAGAVFLLLGLSAVSSVFGASRAQEVVAKPPPMNVLVFLADDLRVDQLGCAGHPVVQTPHVDRLAERGVRFTESFVTTPICASSRASLLTGWPEQTTNSTFGRPPLRDALVEASVPTLLRDAGYRTGFVGKLGVRMPKGATDRMYDVFRPLHRGPYRRPMPDGTLRHITDRSADFAVEFLQEQDAAQPFFLSVHFNAPHAEDGDKEDHFPWPPSADGLYEDIVPGPPRLGDEATFSSHPAFLRESMNRDRWYWRWDTEEKWQKNVRAYWRMVTGVDHAVGRVVEALKQAGLADTTLIVFTSDNGYYLGERGFAGKWSHYEPSLRVPLIVVDPSAPESRRGVTEDALALNIDLSATCLDVAGVEVPPMAGRSLRGPTHGEIPADWRTDFFCEHGFDHDRIPAWIGVREAPWVYARYVDQEPPHEFLHNLELDPDQLENLADDAACAPVLVRLRSRCDELAARYATESARFDAGDGGR